MKKVARTVVDYRQTEVGTFRIGSEIVAVAVAAEILKSRTLTRVRIEVVAGDARHRRETSRARSHRLIAHQLCNRQIANLSQTQRD